MTTMDRQFCKRAQDKERFANGPRIGMILSFAVNNNFSYIQNSGRRDAWKCKIIFMIILVFFQIHSYRNQEVKAMRYLRKLQTANPAAGRYLYVSIPISLCGIFKTDLAIVEQLPDGKGIVVKPAKVEAI